MEISIETPTSPQCEKGMRYSKKWKCVHCQRFCGDNQVLTYENKKGQTIRLSVSNYHDEVKVLDVCKNPINFTFKRPCMLDDVLDYIMKRFCGQPNFEKVFVRKV